MNGQYPPKFLQPRPGVPGWQSRQGEPPNMAWPAIVRRLWLGGWERGWWDGWAAGFEEGRGTYSERSGQAA